MLMAPTGADCAFRPSPAAEFAPARQMTRITVSSGPDGHVRLGTVVARDRHGLSHEIFVTRSEPYFLETAPPLKRRRVRRIAKESFRDEAKSLGIAVRLTCVDESVLMLAVDAGALAIVLVSGYRMNPRGQSHWVSVFGREGCFVLLHDAAAVRDERGLAAAPETCAGPGYAFTRMTQCGRDNLPATILIGKGPSP